MKVGLGNFWNVVVISLVVEKAEKFTRLCSHVGVACSGCSCVLEVAKYWVMWDGSMDVRYGTHNVRAHIHRHTHANTVFPQVVLVGTINFCL